MKFIIALFALAAVCAAVEHEVPILRSTSDIDVDGSFSFGYETGDGTSHDASGNADGVQGRFAFTAPDGQRFEVSYVADANGGFQPQGAHLPVGPPTPEHVLRALDWIRTHPQKEEH